MPVAYGLDEDLLRRLPLPLAQLYRRAHNAKTPQERHHAAYYLWEAALKLLGSVAIVAYAELSDHDDELAQRLQNLARPSLGHWWEFLRRLLPVLANQGDAGFAAVRDLLLGRSRDDLPHAAGLDALLVQVLEGWDTAPAKVSVRPTELYDRLVRYRNREIGHGAVGQRPVSFYERVGRTLMAGVPELLGRIDVLAGRRLLYLADVRRHGSGGWLVERYELRGETPRRLESLEVPDGEAVQRLLPNRLYLESTALGPGLLSSGDPSALTGNAAAAPNKGGSSLPRTMPLHPLVVYDADNSEALFLNARRGRRQIVYLSYSTGREVERDDLAREQRQLLARVLHVPVDAPSLAEWAARSQAEERSDAEEPATTPRRLGEFELLSELGRGGMGVVYRAWQPSLGRQVAVKSLYRMGDPKAEARFAREVRALGHVEHPHLVKIFTSASEGEQWFYAMELVEGATLSAICDKLQSRNSRPDTVDLQTWQQAVSTVCTEARKAEKPVSNVPSNGSAASAAPTNVEVDVSSAPVHVGQGYVRQVVELVRQVASATHALHERGILHRDIKPGNIMVTADGNQAVLMDLGLAQLADDVEGRLTKTRQFVGTLRYASPEQVLAVGGLDRRSDIYNLGATLWELLTLRPMFNATEQTPTPELMRRIQVEDPEKLRKHHPGLSRDLEAIVLKCLEKDPGRRYPSVRDLVRDLTRYQNGEPVQARPVGELQRAWRWCRRNPSLSATLAALLVVLLGSILSLTLMYIRAERQRQVAQRREAEARAITKFYEQHVLMAARPKGWFGGSGKDVTLKEALDQATRKIDEDFVGQPELEATICHTLGMTYQYLGELKAANPLLEKAYHIRVDQLGPDDPATLTSLHDLAFQRWRQGKAEEAEMLCRQAFQRRRRVLGDEHEDTLYSQLNLGLFLQEQSKLVEAELLLREAVEVCKRALGPDHHHTLYGQNDLACTLNAKGQHEEALELDRQTLEGRRRALGPDHPDTLRSMGNLAYTLSQVGKIEEAAELDEQVVEARRRSLGDDHIETLLAVNNLAFDFSRLGDLERAEALDRKALEGRRRALGPDHPHSWLSENNLADTLRRERRYADAEHLYRQSLKGRRHRFGEDNGDTLFSMHGLAQLLEDQGKIMEAEALYRRTWEGRKRVHGAEHDWTLTTQNSLAALLAGEGKAEEAEKLFSEVLAARRKTLRPHHPDLADTLADYGLHLTDKGRSAEAEPLLRECVSIREKKFPRGHWQIAGARGLLGGCLAEQNKFAEAEPLLLDSFEDLHRAKWAPPKRTAWTRDRIIALYEKWDKPEQAKRWRIPSEPRP